MQDGLIYSAPVAPSFEGVTLALAALTQKLVPVGESRFDVLGIELVAAEVLNNCVEHGAGTKEAPVIVLSCQIADGVLSLKITENGDAYAVPGREMAAAGAAQSCEHKLEGGFGWHLIHSLTTDVRYHREQSLNHLTLGFGEISKTDAEVNHA